MKQLSSRIERLVAGLVLGIAFLVMASIIVPKDTQATSNGHDPGHASEQASHAKPTRTEDIPSHGSIDPHVGLVELGVLESSCYLVRMYAGEQQPLYTIIDLTDGSELGTLMTAEEVDRWFPELNITTTSFDNFNHSSHPHAIMSAESLNAPDFN